MRPLFWPDCPHGPPCRPGPPPRRLSSADGFVHVIHVAHCRLPAGRHGSRDGSTLRWTSRSSGTEAQAVVQRRSATHSVTEQNVTGVSDSSSSLLLYVHRDSRDYWGRGTQNGYLVLHTAPVSAEAQAMEILLVFERRSRLGRWVAGWSRSVTGKQQQQHQNSLHKIGSSPDDVMWSESQSPAITLTV